MEKKSLSSHDIHSFDKPHSDTLDTQSEYLANKQTADEGLKQDLQSYIEKQLIHNFKPQKMLVTDTSHLHLKHKGNTPGSKHFKIYLKSEAFKGLSPLQRHRKVMNLFKDMIPFPIHALALTLTP